MEDYNYEIVNGKARYLDSKGWVDDDEIFHISSQYLKFCKNAKDKIEYDYEMRMLKEKLDYEYKTHGEVDPIDQQRYLNYVMGSYK